MHRYVVFLLIGFTACSTAPKPSGRYLASVSFVNTGPQEYTHLRVSIDGAETAARLEALGGYREEWVELRQPLSVRPRVRVSWNGDAHRVQAPVVFVEPPSRRDPTREYHMRVRISGPSAFVELEPYGAAAARRAQVQGVRAEPQAL